MKEIWARTMGRARKIWEKMPGRYWRHPIFMTLLWGIVAALVLALGWGIAGIIHSGGSMQRAGSILFLTPFLSLLTVPGLLTVQNCAFAFLKLNGEQRRTAQAIEIFTIVLGCILSLLYFSLTNIVFSDWQVQLYNSQVHSPLEIGALPTVFTLAAVGIAGYGVLRFMPMEKQPPLLTVLCLSALYLGIALAVVWCIQLAKHPSSLPLMLLPANMVVIAIQTIKTVAGQRAALPMPEGKPWLIRLSKLLSRVWAAPMLGFIAAIPLLGILVILLTLFGQEPDGIIRAWTHTADWTLSQRIGPQNIYFDEHYLCTVAAGGHRRMVRPLRVGKRHGHRVVVNRQLCVANAFEQLLAERLPRFHRGVRGLYDRLGYPVARHIRSPYVADIIYLAMKPLEWFFLGVLYLFDRCPENRIAVQYPHTPPPAPKA